MKAMMTAALLGALIMAASARANAQTQVVVQTGETLLEVRAVGEAPIVPDVASFSIGVVSTGTSAREASDANSRAIADVIAGLRGAGAQDRDIRTQHISVSPRFDRRGGPSDDAPRIVGYVAQNTVLLTSRDLRRAPRIIAGAYDAGANNVQGPSLSIADPSAAIVAAREDALAKARQQAEAYAAGLNMRISRVLRVSERARSTSGRDLLITASRAQAYSPSQLPPPVEAGELIQRVDLAIEYALVPK